MGDAVGFWAKHQLPNRLSNLRRFAMQKGPGIVVQVLGKYMILEDSDP